MHKFYWSSYVAVTIVLGARNIVPVVCSIVLLRGSDPYDLRPRESCYPANVI